MSKEVERFPIAMDAAGEQCEVFVLASDYDALAAELAAIRAAGGEVVEVVAWEVEKSITSLSFSRPRLTFEAPYSIDRVIREFVDKAQHQRIVAAMAAELGEAREQIENYKSQFGELHIARNMLSRLSAAGFEIGDDLAGRIVAMRTELEAARKQETAIPYSAGLSAFAKDLIDGALQGGNFDGGEIQELAVKCGLLQVENRTESCGEHCACAEFGFPSECYRLVKFLPPLAGQVSVRRELLRRVCWPVVSGSDRHTHSEAVAELRALLATPSMEVKHGD